MNLDGYKKPTEIVRDRIILEAKRQLRYSEKAIKEIAYDLGFEDPTYFNRIFKKAESVSPKQYRVNYQKLG